MENLKNIYNKKSTDATEIYSSQIKRFELCLLCCAADRLLEFLPDVKQFFNITKNLGSAVAIMSFCHNAFFQLQEYSSQKVSTTLKRYTEVTFTDISTVFWLINSVIKNIK